MEEKQILTMKGIVSKEDYIMNLKQWIYQNPEINVIDVLMKLDSDLEELFKKFKEINKEVTK